MAMSNSVAIARPICILSDCRCFVDAGCTLHCAAGRDLKVRSLHKTYRLITDPMTATIIIGTLILAAWIEKMKLGITEAAASEVKPITNRNPLNASTAAQALCSRMNTKLVSPATHELRRHVRASSR